jgi:hypothetical protein
MQQPLTKLQIINMFFLSSRNFSFNFQILRVGNVFTYFSKQYVTTSFGGNVNIGQWIEKTDE